MNEELKLDPKLKDAYLAVKQGEALERISTPRNHEEALSLGQYQHQAAYAISCVDLHQQLIFQLTGFNGNALTNFTETIGRSSGSIGFARAEKTLEAISTIGQYVPLAGYQQQPLQPESVDLNK